VLTALSFLGLIPFKRAGDKARETLSSILQPVLPVVTSARAQTGQPWRSSPDLLPDVDDLTLAAARVCSGDPF